MHAPHELLRSNALIAVKFFRCLSLSLAMLVVSTYALAALGRLPRYLLDSIKVAANAHDVPYQSLSKVWLKEKLQSR
jgi:hypothetical protein